MSAGIMNALKTWLREWLEIPTPSPVDLERKIDKSFGKIGTINREQILFEVDLRNAKVDASNALHEAMELQRKFDALAEALGVYVVANADGPASIHSTRVNGLMADAERYIAAALLADNFMSAERRMLEQRRKMLADFAQEFSQIKGKPKAHS